MKCPVCGKENRTMLCSECGFDSSRDYGRYPTFGAVGSVRMPSNTAPKGVREEKKKTDSVLVEDMISAFGSKCRREQIKSVTFVASAADMPVEAQQADTTDMHQNSPAREKKSRKKPAGVLRADEGPAFGRADEHPVFGSKYPRWKIESVTFVDTLKGMPKDAWDVSADGDGSVKAWVKPNGLRYDLYIGGWGTVRTGKSCKGMFAGYTGVNRFSFGNALDTGAAQDMRGMFRDCRGLRTLDLSSFRTGSVVNMGEMFSSCTELISLNLKGFDTSRVRDMSWMFRDCRRLNGLNISGFDTGSVQNMDGMFYGCKALNDISRPYGFVPSGATTKEIYKDCPADDRPDFFGLRKLFGK